MAETSFFCQMRKFFVELPARRVFGFVISQVGLFHLGDMSLKNFVPLTRLPILEEVRETNIVWITLFFGREQIAKNARMKNGAFNDGISNEGLPRENRYRCRDDGSGRGGDGRVRRCLDNGRGRRRRITICD